MESNPKYVSQQFILRIGPRNCPQGCPFWKGCFLRILPMQLIERRPGFYRCMYIIYHVCIYIYTYRYDMYIERKRERERERRLSLEKNESERHEFEQRIRVRIEEYIEGVQYFNWFSKNGKKHHEKCALQNLNDLKLLVCLKQKNTHPKPNPPTLQPLSTSASFPKPGVTKGANTAANCWASCSSAWPVTKVSKKASLKSLQQRSKTTTMRKEEMVKILLISVDGSQILLNQLRGCRMF